MSLSNKLLLFCLSFITGTFVSSFLKIDNLIAYIFLLVALLATFFVYQNQKFTKWLLVVFFIGIAAGIFRFNLSYPPDKSTFYLKESKIFFIGHLTATPVHKINNQQLILSDIKINPEYSGQSFKDKILIITNLYPDFTIGNTLAVKCDLKKPGRIEDFEWGEYLANSGIYKVCYYPEIKTQKHPSTLFRAGKNTKTLKHLSVTAKSYFVNLIKNNLSLPHSAILSAVLLGERSEINNFLRQIFSRVGIAHIIAISGMHISILGIIIFNIFLYLGFSRQKSFKFIVYFFMLYLLIIGFMPSAIRAVIMGLILAYGEKEGRLSESGRSVVIAATFLLLLNPRLLRWDAGFQLSFAATLGIIYFSDYFSKLFNLIHKIIKNKNQFTDSILRILAMTMSAQIATLPLVVYHFGVLSISGILTNLLVVPSLALLLEFGLLFLIAAIFIPQPLIYILTFPVWLILSYILKIAEIFSKIPGSYVEISQINFIWVIVSYIIITSIYFYLKMKSGLKNQDFCV